MIDLIIAFMALGGTAGFLLAITYEMGMWQFWIDRDFDGLGKS